MTTNGHAPLRFNGKDYAAFLFDMDGTLLDSSAVVERVWREWAVGNGIDPVVVLANVHGVRGEDTVRRFGHANMDIDVEIRRLLKAEMDDVSGIVPIAGIEKFIEKLTETQWAIVTSAPRALAEIRLRAAGLPLPKVVITAEDVTRGKPDPEGFLKAASLLNVPIEACLIFEDSAAGMEAARRAGADFVQIGGQERAKGAVHFMSAYT